MVESAAVWAHSTQVGISLAQCAEVRDSLSPTRATLEYVLIFLTG